MFSHIEERNPVLERNEYITITVILVITFMLRFYVLPAREVIEYDGVHWAMLGKNLFSGKGYTEPEGIFQWYYPPLYPINLGMLWFFMKNMELAGGIVSLIYGTLLPIPIYFLARTCYGKKTALISGILVALYPPLIDVSSAVLADSMFITLSITVILVGYYTLSRYKNIFFPLLGGLIGILYLTKSAGVQYVAVFLLWIIIYGITEKKSRIQISKAVSLFAIGFFIISLPYLIYIKNHFGRWTTSELTSISLFEGLRIDENDYPHKSYYLTPDSSEMELWTSSSYPGRHISLIHILREDPQGFLSRYVRRLKKVSSFLFIPVRPFRIILLLLLCFGFFRSIKLKGHLKKELFLISMLLPMFAMPLITARTIRYMFPLMPIFILFYARGIVEFQEWISCPILKHKSWKGDKNAHGIILNALFMIIVSLGIMAEVGSYFTHLEEGRKNYDPLEHKQIGMWINSNLGSGLTIMAVSPHIAFYAEGRHVTLPWAELPEVLTYAHNKGVEYLAVGERYVPSERPLLAFLLDEKKAPGQLKLIYKLTGRNRKKILLYKLIDDTG